MYDCANACPDDVLSGFTRKQFETAGLADIAVRICRAEPLSVVDAQRLANAPLPLLARLVELWPNHERCHCPAVDPVVYLPLAEWLAADDPETVVSKAVSAIRESTSQLAALLEQDERVRDFGDCVRTLHVVIDAPENLAHNIFQAATERLAQDTESTGISLTLASSGSHALPARQAAGALRDIALARLASPRRVEIRAPAGPLGIKTAHVALSFGANHLGDAAVNRETASSLRLPTLADLADALRYDTPTPI